MGDGAQRFVDNISGRTDFVNAERRRVEAARDRFASAAMAALIGLPTQLEHDDLRKATSKAAYDMADAMIAERERRGK